MSSSGGVSPGAESDPSSNTRTDRTQARGHRFGRASQRVFVSYRRADSAPYAGRLFDELARGLGKTNVFMDVHGISPGSDFVDVIEATMSRCDVCVVVIGPNWTSANQTWGGRRLDDPEDTVRLEIEKAGEHHLRVVPVLVGGAAMPTEQDLPAPLAWLARRQAVALSDQRWHREVGELLQALRSPEGTPDVTRTPARTGLRPTPLPPAQDVSAPLWRWVLLTSSGVLVVILVVALVVVNRRVQTPPVPLGKTTPTHISPSIGGATGSPVSSSPGVPVGGTVPSPPGTCTNPYLGYTVTLPPGWQTNKTTKTYGPCQLFAEGAFNPTDASTNPLVAPMEFGSLADSLSALDDDLGLTVLRTIVINGLHTQVVDSADEPQLGQHTYAYLVDLSRTTLVGLIVIPAGATAPQRQSQEQVLDAVMDSLLLAPSGCKNLNDGRCGDFFWFSDPPPNQPITANITVPRQPVAGQPTTISVTATDPDASELTASVCSYDGGCVGSAVEGPESLESLIEASMEGPSHGGWDPPTPTPGTITCTFTHVYAVAGTYGFAVNVSSSRVITETCGCTI